MSMLSKFTKKIIKSAPLIGNILEIAVPGVSKVLPIISRALGVNSESEIIKALQTDPDAYNKLKQAELTHQVELKKIWLEETRLYLEDVQSARQREVEFVKVTGGRDWMQATIGIIVITGFLISLIGSFVIEIPGSSAQTVNIMTGMLGTMAVTVVAYYFGTSKSSSEKTAMLHQTKTGGTK